MNFLAALLPSRVAAELIGIAIICAALIGGLTWFAHHERAIGRFQVQARWDASIVKQQADALAESQANAKETQRRLERQKENQDAYDAELARARADAASATDAAGRLRQRAEQLAAAARRAASNAAAGSVGSTAPDASGMLSDVLGKAVERSRLLAAYADAARRAGLQCERDYDALKASR